MLSRKADYTTLAFFLCYKSLAMNLYSSLIVPHFTYGNSLMAEINKRLASKLQVQQNNALRVVRNVDISCSLPKLYNELDVGRIETMAKKSACKIVYQAINNKCPDNI